MPSFVIVYNPIGEAGWGEVIEAAMTRRLNLEAVTKKIFLGGRLQLIHSNDKYTIESIFRKGDIEGGIVCAGRVLLDNCDSPVYEAISVAFDVVENSYERINRSRGRYCAVVWASIDSRDAVYLLVDRVGTRPIYYYKKADGQYLISTEESLLVDILDRIGNPVAVSLVGLLSKMLLGYVAGGQTCYSGIVVLRGATTVSLGVQGTESKRYWRWPEAVAAESETEDLAKRAAEIFLKSLQLRLSSESGPQRSFLSGGLDSRMIVGGLRALGKEVLTYTFSRVDALDMILAASFAKSCGAIHHATAVASFNVGGGLPGHIRNGIREEGVSDAEWAGVWSGVGGSGVLGHVDQTETMARAAYLGSFDSVIHEYLERKRARLARGLCTASRAEILQSELEVELCAELEHGDYTINEKKLYHYFVDNVERTHEYGNIEKLERRKIEYITPFYDPEFVEIMFRVPFSVCDRHKFYMKVMAQVGPNLLAVPWQAYPGHIEPAMQLPAGYTRQWSRRQEPEEKREKKVRIIKGLEFVWSGRFPRKTFRKIDTTILMLLEYLVPQRSSGIESQLTTMREVFGSADRDLVVKGRRKPH